MSELKDTLLEQDIQNQENTLSDPSKSSGLSIWISTAIVVALTLTTWFNTHSTLYAVIVFLSVPLFSALFLQNLGIKKRTKKQGSKIKSAISNLYG